MERSLAFFLSFYFYLFLFFYFCYYSHFTDKNYDRWDQKNDDTASGDGRAAPPAGLGPADLRHSQSCWQKLFRNGLTSLSSSLISFSYFFFFFYSSSLVL